MALVQESQKMLRKDQEEQASTLAECREIVEEMKQDINEIQKSMEGATSNLELDISTALETQRKMETMMRELQGVSPLSSTGNPAFFSSVNAAKTETRSNEPEGKAPTPTPFDGIK